jgi:hypothetical protein
MNAAAWLGQALAGWKGYAVVGLVARGAGRLRGMDCSGLARWSGAGRFLSGACGGAVMSKRRRQLPPWRRSEKKESGVRPSGECA